MLVNLEIIHRTLLDPNLFINLIALFSIGYINLVPFTKSQLPFSIISKKLVNSSGSTLISESSIAIISPVDLSIASQTAFAFPFLVCSKV